MEWPVLQAVLWESLSQLLLASIRRNMYMTLRNDTACAAFCGRSPRYCTRAEKWRKQRLWIQIPVLSHLHFVSTVFITRLQLYGTSNEIWLQEKNPFYQQWNLTPGEKSLVTPGNQTHISILPGFSVGHSTHWATPHPPQKETSGQSTYRSLFSLQFLLFHEQT